MANEKKVTAAQLALSWVVAQGADIVPIFGTRTRVRLEENVKAADVGWTEKELERMDRAIPKGVTAGPRYADMSGVNR